MCCKLRGGLVAILAANFLLTYLCHGIEQHKIRASVKLQGELRVKRSADPQHHTGTSVLTVEWEGIHSRVPNAESIGGFVVEYRSENEQSWVQHKGIIAYKGPHTQYRVRIRDLPSGPIYFVRVKVLGRNNEILLETPEIEAKSEAGSTLCKPGEIGEPRNVRLHSSDAHSLTFVWEAPHCGHPNRYEYRNEGYDEHVRMDAQTGTADGLTATVTGLLPGTGYMFRVRALAHGQQPGPWTDTVIRGSTGGSTPSISNDIKVLYTTDREIRIEWEPYRNAPVQYYELIILEDTDERDSLRVSRYRATPGDTSYVFPNLRASSRYQIGVVAVTGQNQPGQVYRLQVQTAPGPAVVWPSSPNVQVHGIGKVTVHWDEPGQPFADKEVRGFLVEFRPPNDTSWHRYGNIIAYQPNQKQYSTEIGGLNDKSIYIIKVYIVDSQNQVVGVSPEVTVGQQTSSNLCLGPSGAPKNLRIFYAGETSITYNWERPTCDERFGPVEGYEYLHWPKNSREPDKPVYTTNSKVTIDGLSPLEEYIFKIRSQSRGGKSAWAQPVHAQTKSSTTIPDPNDDKLGNIYNLQVRIINDRSYMRWEPLQADRGHIRKFKLQYQMRAGGDQWERIEERPERFDCPAGVGDRSIHYCYDLSNLEYNKQYTADISYELDDGSQSAKGNHLFFMLIKTVTTYEPHTTTIGPPVTPSTPNMMTIRFVTDTSAEMKWLPPLSADLKIDEYKITVRVLKSDNPRVAPGTVEVYRTSGTTFKYLIQNLQLDTMYNISLEAGCHGTFGPAVSELVSAGPNIDAKIELPRVVQRGEITTVQWEVVGSTSRWCCFQVDVRGDRDYSWRPHGREVANVPGERSYTVDLGPLQGSSTYLVQVRALSQTDRSTVCTSAPARFTTQCQAPRQPPRDLSGSTPDSRLVQVSWAQPDRSTWGCSDVWYIIEATPSGRPAQIYQVRADPNGQRMEHRIPTEPGLEWRVRIQTASTGGVSDWSPEILIKTASEAYCSPPTLTPQGNTLRVEWSSTGRGAGVVFGYYIQYRTSQDPRWQRNINLVPFRGDNEQYNGYIQGLPSNIRIAVRIEVVDLGQRIIYTSPEATTELTCAAPEAPPNGLSITAPDARHVRLIWEVYRRTSANCPDVHYELQVLEPRGVPVSRLHGTQTQHVIDARPGQRWTVQLRAVNTAGPGPWSAPLSVTTPPMGELINGLQVIFQHQTPALTWRSAEGVDELVQAYRVEVQLDQGGHWRPHSSGIIPYTGWQRPYIVPLPDLPEGRTVYVRVVVLDHNNGEAYTSPGLPVNVPSRCKAPDQPPSNLRVQPIGTNQVRIHWQPLARNQWNCDSVWYIVKYSADRTQTQGYKNFTSYDNSGSFDSAPNSRWEFQIQAANPAGSSPWSPKVSGSTEGGAPGQIKDLRITPLAPDSLQLTWQPPTDSYDQITGYDIIVTLLSKGLCNEQRDREQVFVSRDPSFVLKNLYPHSRYEISVRAKSTIPGPALTKETTTPDGVPSGPPRSLQSRNVQSRQVSLTWQAPICEDTNGDIRGYEYEIMSPTDRNLASKRVPDTSATVDSLNPYTKYLVKVRAFTSQGAGPWSPEIPVTTLPEELKTAPTLRILETHEQSVKLLWFPPYPAHADIDKYKVRLCVVGSGRCNEKEFRIEDIACPPDVVRNQQRTQQGRSTAVHCATLTSLEEDRQYDFTVAALPKDGRKYGPWSNTESTRIGGGPVKILKVNPEHITDQSIEISWTVKDSDRPRVRAYRIIVHPTGNLQSIQEHTVDPSVMLYTIDTLMSNTEYNVTVQAKTDLGYHPGTSKRIRTEDSTIHPLTTSPIVVDRKPKSLTIEWQAPRDAKKLIGYLVEYKPLDDRYQQHGSTIHHSNDKLLYRYEVTGLMPNTEYFIRIILVGKNNVKSSPSPEVSAKTECLAPTSTPIGFKIDPVCSTSSGSDQQSLLAAWQKPSQSTWNCDQVSFEISYINDNQPTEQLVRVPQAKQEYSFMATPFSKWSMKIRALNKAGPGPWSSMVDVVSCEGAPGPVKNLVVTPLSPNEAQVAWQPPTEKTGQIFGYDVSMRLKHRLACPEEEPRDVSRAWFTVYSVKDLRYVLTGLLPYAEYEVKVRARGQTVGPEEMRILHTPQQTPGAPPLNLKTSYVLEKSVGFTWEPVECSQRHGPINNYEYELLGHDSWARQDVRIANTSQTKVDVDGLTPFTRYIMRVKAYNNVGAGPPTADLEIVTAKAMQPLPPQDLHVVVEGQTFIVVSWSPPYPPYGPLDAYKVMHARENTDRPGHLGQHHDWVNSDVLLKSDRRIRCPDLDAALPKLCYNITDLESGVAYRIQVAARIEGGSFGAPSQHIIAKTILPLPDTVKSIRLVSKTTDTLTVAWVPPSDPYKRITDYKVTVEPVAKDEGLRAFTVIHPDVQHTIRDLKPDTNYVITVHVGIKGTYGQGVSSIFATDAAAPIPLSTAPTIINKGPNHLTVDWPTIPDPNRRVLSYIVEYRRLEDPNWFDYAVDHDSNSYRHQKRIDSLEPDTRYVVRVKVLYREKKLSEPSPNVEGRTDCKAPISAPSSFSARAPVPTQVNLDWQAPARSTWQCASINYRLEFQNSSSPTAPSIELPGSSVSHTFLSLPFTKWTIRIRSENSAGHSPWSDQLVVQTPEGQPGPVQNVQADPAGPQRIKVTWEPPSNPNGKITGYIVSYQPKGTADCDTPAFSVGAAPVTVWVQGEKHILKDLLPATSYEIVVKAKTTLEGPPSTPVIAKTEEMAPTGAPTNVSATFVGKMSAIFNWDEPECQHRNGLIEKYSYALEGLDPWVQGQTIKGVVSGERFEAQNLVPFTRYKFLVQAVNSKGNGPSSPPVNIKTKPGAPPAPTDIQADQLSPSAVSISFLPPNPPHGILDEYRIRHTPSDRISWQEIRRAPDELACSGARPERLCVRIGELEPVKEYIVQIAAHTRDGEWGEYSQSTMITTTDPDIPVLEKQLHIRNIKSDSVTVLWDGLPSNLLKNVQGYILEYNQEGQSEWHQYNDVIQSKGPHSGQIFTETVKNLMFDTNYFFRLRVVDKKGRRGNPGPDEKTTTLCGKPQLPPQNIKATATSMNQVRVNWEVPPQSSWRCRDVIIVMKYQNDSSTGFLDFEDLAVTEQEFYSHPGAKWTIEMRTQALDFNQQKGEASDWSQAHVVHTPRGFPGQIDLDCLAVGFDSAKCTWELPKEDQGWSHGVDFTYQLKQKGDCPPSFNAPVTEFNVQNRVYDLKNLEPYSLYTITVTPRIPGHLARPGVRPPSSTVEIRTGEKEPSGQPRNVRVDVVGDRTATTMWEPPECDKQNGEIVAYEYQIKGVDPWVLDSIRQAKTQRRRLTVEQLQPGTTYVFKVRAYNAAGAGPFSDPVQFRTTGSGIGAPQELQPINIDSRKVSLTWRPPVSSRGPIDNYRLRYGGGQNELVLRPDELACRDYQSPLIVDDNLCYTLSGLSPKTTYDIEAQAQSHNDWGPWSSPIYVTTTAYVPPGDGMLKAIYTDHESIKVRWEPPYTLKPQITYYLVSIYDTVDSRANVPLNRQNVSSQTNEFHFKKLQPNHAYNVTVEGGRHTGSLWFIPKIFSTADPSRVCSELIEAPSNLLVMDKTDQRMRVSWSPSFAVDNDVLHHYQVNVSRFDPDTGLSTEVRTYKVKYSDNQVDIDPLIPTSIYNISIQTFSAYQPSCDVLWGAFSTLDPPGDRHILKLKRRTTKTLHVYWNTLWVSSTTGYILNAEPQWNMMGRLPNTVRSEAPPGKTDHVIRSLTPGTIYNVTLTPKGSYAPVAWGAYSTLPAGSLVVPDLKTCDETQFAFSLTWDPIEDVPATHYQVRYSKSGQQPMEMPPSRDVDLSCPGTVCGKYCYLIFNIDSPADSYIVQVRAKVEDHWNRWKALLYTPSYYGKPVPPYNPCCIVPPWYYVHNIGHADTSWQVWVKAVPNDTYVKRYYVVVDEREVPGDIRQEMLFDKVTADRRGIPYYVAAAFDRRTLIETGGRSFLIGDGQVHGGFLNYPLVKGKKYNWAFVTSWDVNGQPVFAYSRDESARAGFAFGAWPWWWLLLFLLLLLLLLLLLCLLCWCLSGRYHRRKRLITRIDSAVRQPLLREDVKEAEMSRNLKSLEERIDKIRTQLESKIQSGYATQASRGEFEEGYRSGYGDAHRLPSDSNARAYMYERYGGRGNDFYAGYVQGLRDAGMHALSQSTQHLAPRDLSGYSAGYMQGFRDGDSGIFGKKLTVTLLNRLEEQYPNQPEFKQGYIDGFKDATGRKEEGRLLDSLTQVTDRLTTIERSQLQPSSGDEARTTKIYHVYNQLPESSVGYQTTGQRLAQELEELSSETISKRSTMRRHYTPGDYLKYASDTEGVGTLPTSHRRSMSASNLAQEDAARSRSRERTAAINQYNDTYSRRYNYRARSDMGGSSTLNRRYPSQTILDGVRPGPATQKREAVETLQRELGSLKPTGRSVYSKPAPTSYLTGGYSSDTGYNVYDTVRSGTGTVAPPVDEQREGSFRYTTTQSQTRSNSGVTMTTTFGAQAPLSGGSTMYNTAAASPTPLAAPTSAPSPRTVPIQISTTSAPGRSATSPHSSISSPDPQARQQPPVEVAAASSSYAAASSTARHTGAAGGGILQSRLQSQPDPSSLNQAYKLVGAVSSSTAAESSGSEAAKEESWTEELMRIAREPMPETLERMKSYSASLSRMPTSPGPRRTDYIPGGPRSGEAQESVAESSFSSQYKEERSGAKR